MTNKRLTKVFLIICIMVLTCVSSNIIYADGVKSWQMVGEPEVYSGDLNPLISYATYQSVSYMGYVDTDNSNIVTVQNSTDQTLSIVEAFDFVTTITGLSLRVFNNNLYISITYMDERYIDPNNIDETRIGGICILKYNGTSWEQIASTPLALTDPRTYTEIHTSFVIDSEGAPYITYCGNDYTDMANVLKYNVSDSTWVNVGNSNFSTGFVAFSILAIDVNNTPFILYAESDTAEMFIVKNFVNGTWESVGNSGQISVINGFTSFAINNGIPVIDYIILNGNEVLKYTMKYDIAPVIVTISDQVTINKNNSEVTVNISSNQSVQASVIFVLKDSNSKVKQVYFHENNTIGTANNYVAYLDNMTYGDTVKILIWNDRVNMIPLCTSKPFSVY